jgi:1-pyrroline-5-carboxylate dehydrogenase
MGTPRDFTNFVNAVIDEAAFDSIVAYIEKARSAGAAAEIIAGGKYDKSQVCPYPPLFMLFFVVWQQ